MLKANKDFRLLFADRVYKHFFNGGALTQENVSRRFSEMRTELMSVIPNMNPYIVNTWTPTRQSVFLNACIREGVYTFAGPSFTVNGTSRYGGDIGVRGLAGNGLFAAGGVGPLYARRQRSGPVRCAADAHGDDAGRQRYAQTRPGSDGPGRGRLAVDPRVRRLALAAVVGRPGGVGFERSSGYEAYISADVGNQMYNVNGSCYIRIPFEFNGDRDALETMTLKMQYDDGFVAYLNGTEVARRNFAGDPAWNSAANAAHDDVAAVVFEPIDLSEHLVKLRQGNNILAIQGMNAGATSSDFLIGVELVAAPTAASQNTAGAQVYAAPITLSKSTVVKARVQSGSTWSALAEAVFAVGPVKESLRISEIMFHPEISDPKSQISETEYIELTNIGAEAINLNLVRFTKGIDFTFPDVQLAPGAFCLVVKDRGAFESRYGPGLPIAGQYAGSLSDGGERIELCDALGAVIHNFQYRDDWFEITDGSGFSLTVAESGRNARRTCGTAEAHGGPAPRRAAPPAATTAATSPRPARSSSMSCWPTPPAWARTGSNCTTPRIGP